MFIHEAGQLQASKVDNGVGLGKGTATQNSPRIASNTTVPSRKSKNLQVLLCGCGNAVHVLTSYLGQRPPTPGGNTVDSSSEYNFKVNILSLCHSDRLLTSLLPGGYIHCSNYLGTDTYGKANLISGDPALVVPGCSLILFALPTDRHEMYLNAMLPYIQEGTIIGSMPGEGGFDICVRDVLGPALADKCVLFSMETLPWACRIQTFGQEVQVLGTKRDIDLCVYPSAQCWEIRDLVQSMIGRLPLVETSATSNFLGSTLMNPNAIAHPTILYGLLRDWDGATPFAKQPLFYQAIDEFTAKALSAVSSEILQIKMAIKKLYPNIDLAVVRSLEEFFEVSYADDIADHSSLQRMFVTNKGYDGLTMPTKEVESGGYLPLFDHRYLNEDLPCGILVQKGIAELAGVLTPVMDEIICWCQDRCVPPKEYLVDGKLKGKDVATTKAPQRYGFQDLKTFMEANRYV